MKRSLLLGMILLVVVSAMLVSGRREARYHTSEYFDHFVWIDADGEPKGIPFKGKVNLKSVPGPLPDVPGFTRVMSGEEFSRELKKLPRTRIFGRWSADPLRVWSQLKDAGIHGRTLFFVVQGGNVLWSNRAGLRTEGTGDDVSATVLDYLGLPSGKRGRSLIERTSALDPGAPIRVGFFLGGRTAILYRAWLAGELPGSELWSKSLYDRSGGGYLEHRNFYRIPEEWVPVKGGHQPFKATGDELLDFMKEGEAVAATIGETAFLKAVSRGEKIVAVAELGADRKDQPGHAVILCNNRPYRGPQDLKGLRFGSRRSAGGDEVFFKEWFSQQGLEVGRDYELLANLPDDKMDHLLENGELDGAYYRVMSLPHIPRHCRVVRKLDWVDAGLSSSVLVFRADWLDRNRSRAVEYLRGVVRQVRREAAMSAQERRVLRDRGKKGVEIEMVDVDGMQLPEVKDPPQVRADNLRAMQALLVKHGVLRESRDLEKFIDHSVLEEAAK